MRLKLNFTLWLCILWMVVYFNVKYFHSHKYLTIDQAYAISSWLFADAIYFMAIVFTKKNMWTWTTTSLLFFSTANNMVDELWGDPLVFSMQEIMFCVASVVSSFAIGILTFKHPIEKTDD